MEDTTAGTGKSPAFPASTPVRGTRDPYEDKKPWKNFGH
jgi:hypothetical protein